MCCRDEPGNSAFAEQYEVMVNEEVIIPLAAAARATPLVARKKDEVRRSRGSHHSVVLPPQSALLRGCSDATECFILGTFMYIRA